MQAGITRRREASGIAGRDAVIGLKNMHTHSYNSVHSSGLGIACLVHRNIYHINICHIWKLSTCYVMYRAAANHSSLAEQKLLVFVFFCLRNTLFLTLSLTILITSKLQWSGGWSKELKLIWSVWFWDVLSCIAFKRRIALKRWVIKQTTDPFGLAKQRD